MTFWNKISHPFTSLLAPFLPKEHPPTEKECEECLQTAGRVTISFGQFLILSKSWIVGFGLHRWFGGATLTYPSILLFGKLDQRSTHYALATLMGRASLYCLKESSPSIAKTTFCLATAVAFLNAAYESKEKGYLSDSLDKKCSELAPRMARFFSSSTA